MSVFVLAPDVALTLSKAKHLDTGSNVGLLDATGVADGTTLAGVPVLVSTDVAAGNAWAWTAHRCWSCSAPVPRSPARLTQRSITTPFRSGYRPHLVGILETRRCGASVRRRLI
jgi:hypothetical protein